MEAKAPRLSLDVYYESFETFMQQLAPGELSTETLSCEVSPSTDIVPVACTAMVMDSSAADAEQPNSSSEEIKRLQELVTLLQTRVDATQKVVEIQEQEVCREMDLEDGETRSNYEKLLNRWRREVCMMFLKQRVDALQFEQRQLQHTQKEQHLTVQLHEARALVEVLKQKERNLQAEIAILTTGQKLAEMTMRAEAARRQHEMEGSLKGITRAAVEIICNIVDEHSTTLCLQLDRLSQASCRLDIYGQRLSITEQQVVMIINYAGSEVKSSGNLSHRRKVEENPERSQLDKRRDRTALEQVVRRTNMDQSGRANQLEVLLAATKSQLAEECLHTKELQEKVGRGEAEVKEAVRKATKKAQEQSDRDLAAIKRQHAQAIQSLQQKVTRLQNEHAKSIVAHHQLQRKLAQQQQEFVQTLNQRDNEFRKSLDAKEIEVNGLLDEQNALLNKLKKFWRPILNSSAAKVFTEKSQRNQLHTPPGQQSLISHDLKSDGNTTVTTVIATDGSIHRALRSVETQTVDLQEKKKKLKVTVSEKEVKPAACEPQDVVLVKPAEASSRLSTPGKRSRPDSKARKSEDDLISSYLTKLQKSYVTSSRQSNQEHLTHRSLDLQKEPFQEDEEHHPSLMFVRSEDGRVLADSNKQVSLASHKDWLGSSDGYSVKQENLPQYIICVPPQEQGNALFGKAQSLRKRQAAVETSVLQNKLENLETLSETLLGQRM